MPALELPAPHELPPVQAYLEARLGHAELVLERLLLDPDGPGGLARIAEGVARIQQATRAAASAGVVLPDERLRRRYQLSGLELDVLWTSTAPAIDPLLVTQLRRIEGGQGRDWLDPSLLARGLGADRTARLAVLAALDPDGALRRTQLVRVAPGDHAHGRDLVPASWLPGYLRGVRALGARLEGVCALIDPTLADTDVPLPPRALDLLPLLDGFWASPAEDAPSFARGGLDHPRGIAVLIHGAAGSGRSVLTRALATRLQRRMLVVDAAKLRPATHAVAAELIEAACSEAAAFGELLVIRSAQDVAWPGIGLAVPLARAIASHQVVTVLVGLDEGPLSAEIEPLLAARHHHEMRPAEIDPAHLWLTNLPPSAQLDPNLDFDAFARSIHLTPAQVRSAARVAVLTAGPGGTLDEAGFDRAVKGQLSGGIGKLAEMEDTPLRMTDLVLPPEQLQQIEEVIAAARNRDLVLRRWGLRRTIKRGLSISCLFDGEPGTGKTLAAEVICGELGLQLLRINVASIVDKFIGETEKNLTRIFDQARPDTTLLLFDEADSLFTKRTEVQHAVDRYSNMDVNVLLQLIERFEGTAVLTTNLRSGIDPAFMRRIMFKVRFDRPDVDQRRRIWQIMLPASIPTEERIDYDRLARLDLAGGEIKNAVVRAAYAAAREGRQIRMRHLAEAAAAEASSTGRVYFDVSSQA